MGGGTADRVRRRGWSGARHAHATLPPSFWEHGTGKDLRRRDQTPGKERGEAVAETGRRGMDAERGERGNDGGSAKGGMRDGSKAPAQSTGRQRKTERDGRGKRESGSPQIGETRNKEAMVGLINGPREGAQRRGSGPTQHQVNSKEAAGSKQEGKGPGDRKIDSQGGGGSGSKSSCGAGLSRGAPTRGGRPRHCQKRRATMRPTARIRTRLRHVREK